jgi:hypothetical protein
VVGGDQESGIARLSDSRNSYCPCTALQPVNSQTEDPPSGPRSAGPIVPNCSKVPQACQVGDLGLAVSWTTIFEATMLW